MAIIDASVYIALINAHESGHTAAWAWFQQAQAAGELLAAPAILLSEIAAGLSRGLDNPALAHQVVRQLLHVQLIDIVPVTPALAERAAAIAADYQIRGGDAIYIALQVSPQRREPLVAKLLRLGGTSFDRRDIRRRIHAAGR